MGESCGRPGVDPPGACGESRLPAEPSPGTDDDSLSLEKVFNRRTIRRGMLLFLLITVVALAGVFLYTETGSSIGALTSLRPAYLALILPFSALDLWLGGQRIHVFVRKTHPAVSQWVSFRANLANIFMGAITPSQTGGGPAQLYVLHRAGVSVAEGMAIGVINFLSTIVVFVLGAAASLSLLGERVSPTLRGLVTAALIVFSLQLCWVVVALVRPGVFDRIFRFLTGALARFRRLERTVVKLRAWFTGFVESYRRTCIFFLRRKPVVVAQSMLITALLYLTKFTMAYFIMLGIGGEGPYTDLVAVHMVVYFIAYFSPSPGASGVAEVTTAMLMSTMLAGAMIPVFTLLQRFFLLYVPVVLGVFTVLGMLKSARSAAAGVTTGE